MKKVFCTGALLTALLWTFAPSADAQHGIGFRKVGISGFHFLKVGQGARAAGMGDAFVAVADDINTIFWNPAGLTHIDRPEYTVSYGRWFVNTKMYSGAVGFKTSLGNVAFSYVGFSPESFDERTPQQPNGTGRKIHVGNTAVGMAFAKKLTDKLSFGFHARYIQEDLDLATVKSFDLAIGSIFYTGFRSARIAMSLRNFGKDNTIDLEPFQMPVNFNFAAAMELYGKKGEPFFFTFAFEAAYTVDFKDRYLLGGEAWIANTLALRGGYKFSYDVESYTFGAGVKRAISKGRWIGADVSYGAAKYFEAPIRLSLSGAF
jgi:hypothetical protein